MGQTVSEFSYSDPESSAIGIHVIEVSGNAWRVSVRRNGSHAWLDLPESAAAALAHLLLQHLGRSPDEQAPRIEYRRGDLQIMVEGGSADTMTELGQALHTVLAAGAPPCSGPDDLIERVAEILGVEPDLAVDDLLDLLRTARETILDQDQKIEQLHTEAETARQLVERIAQDRDARPTRADLQQAVADANRFKAQRDKAEASVADFTRGMEGLRKALRAAGLDDMSKQDPGEIARRIAALGEHINHLTGKLSDEGRLHDEQLITGLREQVETLQMRYAEATRKGNGMQVQLREFGTERDVQRTRAERLTGELDAARAANQAMHDALVEVEALLTAHAGPDDPMVQQLFNVTKRAIPVA